MAVTLLLVVTLLVLETRSFVHGVDVAGVVCVSVAVRLVNDFGFVNHLADVAEPVLANQPKPVEPFERRVELVLVSV